MFALAFLIFSDFLRVFCRVALPFPCVSDVTHAHATDYQALTPPPAHAPEGRSTLSNNFFYFFLFSFSRLYPSLNIPYFCFCLSLPLCCYTPVAALCVSSRICSFSLRLSLFCAFSVYLLALCFICPYSLFSVPPPCPTTMSHIPCWGVGQGRTG